MTPHDFLRMFPADCSRAEHMIHTSWRGELFPLLFVVINLEPSQIIRRRELLSGNFWESKLTSIMKAVYLQ